jgi:hypothetical protein
MKIRGTINNFISFKHYHTMMQQIKHVFILVCIFFISFMPCSWAKTSDALICFKATRQIEMEYNLPPHILSAIALTESGRMNKYRAKNIQSPWPWTANVRGKGMFFATKEQALNNFKQLISKKNNMFDIGCMQINWHYHKKAFSSIEQALNPYYNVRYAAEFLTSLYEKTHSWPKAVERYHSATPVHYNRYRKIVAANWIKARNLVSPIDGTLNAFLMNEQFPIINQGIITAHNNNKKTIMNPKKAIELIRMREIAKLRARVRQYAHNMHY